MEKNCVYKCLELTCKNGIYMRVSTMSSSHRLLSHSARKSGSSIKFFWQKCLNASGAACWRARNNSDANAHFNLQQHDESFEEKQRKRFRNSIILPPARPQLKTFLRRKNSLRSMWLAERRAARCWHQIASRLWFCRFFIWRALERSMQIKYSASLRLHQPFDFVSGFRCQWGFGFWAEVRLTSQSESQWRRKNRLIVSGKAILLRILCQTEQSKTSRANGWDREKYI